MLRSEVSWFPTFLRLCREKLLDISKVWTREDNDIIPLLERVLTCDSYRQLVQLLRRHHWVTRQVIYELRTQARNNVPMSHEISHHKNKRGRSVETSAYYTFGSRARDGKFASPDLSLHLGAV